MVIVFESRCSPAQIMNIASYSTSSDYERTIKQTLQYAAEKSKVIKLHYLIGSHGMRSVAIDKIFSVLLLKRSPGEIFYVRWY